MYTTRIPFGVELNVVHNMNMYLCFEDQDAKSSTPQVDSFTMVLAVSKIKIIYSR